MILDLLDRPCYIAYRLDAKSVELGYQWLFVSYIPDGCKVKDRMLLSTTKDSCKKDLGLPYFTVSMHGSSKSDISLDIFKQRRREIAGDELLTDKERQILEERFAEVESGPSKQYVHSLQFKVSPTAVEKMKAFGAGKLAAVSLVVAVETETLDFDEEFKNGTGIDEVGAKVAEKEEPRYIFFKKDRDTNLFIYFCPEGAAIKLKMIYTTIESNPSGLAAELGIDIAKNLELRDPADFEKENFEEVVSPSSNTMRESINSPVMKKPSVPGGGGRRLIRK